MHCIGATFGAQATHLFAQLLELAAQCFDFLSLRSGLKRSRRLAICHLAHCAFDRLGALVHLLRQVAHARRAEILGGGAEVPQLSRKLLHALGNGSLRPPPEV